MYRAAVVHGYFPNHTTAPMHAEHWISAAVAQKAQIVVFAEGALGSNTGKAARAFCERLPSAGATPCDGNATATRLGSSMSCLARKYAVTVLFAMCDVQPCIPSENNCTKWADGAGRYHFNTQLAVGPTGDILAKYHKMHLYDPARCICMTQLQG